MYVTGTSDKKKGKCLKCWAMGLGIIGFEYYYVGKIMKGIGRSFISSFVLFMFFSGLFGTPEEKPILVTGIIIWIILALSNLIKILLGKFTDNVGNYVRE